MSKPIIITGTESSKAIAFEDKTGRISNLGSDYGIKPPINGLSVLALTDEFVNPATSQESNISSTYTEPDQGVYALVINGVIFPKTGTIPKIAEALKTDPKFRGQIQIKEPNETVDFPEITCTNESPIALIEFKQVQATPIRFGFLNESTGSTISFSVSIGIQSAHYAINNNQEITTWLNQNGLWLMDPEPYRVEGTRLPLVFKAMGRHKIKFFIGSVDEAVSIAERIASLSTDCGGIDLERNIAWGCLQNRLSNPVSAIGKAPNEAQRNFYIEVSGLVNGVIRYTSAVPSQSRRIDFTYRVDPQAPLEVFSSIFKHGVSLGGMMTIQQSQNGDQTLLLDSTVGYGLKLEVIFEATTIEMEFDTGTIADNPNIKQIEIDGKPVVYFVLGGVA